MTKKISRRAVATQIGAMAGGVSLLGPALANSLMATPKQTEGPFYPPEPHVETDVDLTRMEGHDQVAQGEIILVRGQITDTQGKPLAGARVDLWQANNNGRYAHPGDPNTAELDPNFQGIGITTTDENGMYGFRTIKPAAYPLSFLGADGWRAQHIHFKFAHPDATELTTQMYFAGDPLLEQDLEIGEIPEDQQSLLITQEETDPESGLPLHRFDVVLA